MAKRRTSGIQRRERASSDAMSRRLNESRGGGLPDWRLLAIGALLVVGLLIVVLVLIFGGSSPNAGTRQPNSGSAHVPVGTSCRAAPQSHANCGSTPYSSLPATSGPHWDPSGIANWGVYTTPQPETQLIHNLEHGGIVIWYDPERVDDAGVQALEDYVDRQTASGISGRYKFIVSPWADAEALPAPVVATSWLYLLPLETADTGAIDEFARAHYGRSPEPNGGPGPPG
jgi:hypothetical protein